MIDYLRVVNNDSKRKSYPRILKESIHSAILEKSMPYHYFTCLLYKKDAADYRNYIGYKKIFNITNNYFYPEGRNKKLENKLIFNKILIENNISTPRIIMYNHGHLMNYKDQDIEIKNTSRLKTLVLECINESKSSSVFIKPLEGEGGKYAFKFSLDSISDEKVLELYKLLEDVSFIFQETIIQHSKINEIYSQSINTLRVHTLKNDIHEEVEIVSALMRIGMNNRVVDNNGMFIKLNIDNWSLSGFSKTFLKNGAHIFEKHPDTNFIFNQYKIPYKEETISILKEVSKLFEDDFIGWDVAITRDGPVIIEGNDGPHLMMEQIACGGFKNRNIYKRIFREYI